MNTETMQITETEGEIRSFLVNNFLFGRAEALDEDEMLFGNVIDSSGALELILFLEDRFGIGVDDEEIANPANFESFKSLVAFINRKLQSRT